MGFPAKSKNKSVALVALGVALTLLVLSRLTNFWALYKDGSFYARNRGSHDIPATPTKKVAVILETRPLENLVPLILHFSTVLGPEWPIHIFTSPLNAMAFQLSPSFNRLLHSGGVHLRDLSPDFPGDYPFHEPHSRSVFLTQSWFWERMDPAEHIFFFTSGSMICAKAERTLDDFLEYDFIGAPLGKTLGGEFGVSGGLSLRNRKRMLDVVKRSDSKSEKKGEREDAWFWKRLKILSLSEEASKKANLPDVEAARRLAVGPIWADEPFGYELAHVHEEKMDDVLRWCPEYVISMFNITA